MTPFESAIRSEKVVLAEGSVIERLRRAGASLDEDVLASALALDPDGRDALLAIYDSYLEIAEEAGLPMVVLAPTWRAGAAACEKAGLDLEGLNAECVALVKEAAGARAGLPGRVFVGGLLSSRGDAYRPQEALPRDISRSYHARQIRALVGGGAEFVLASTIPSVEEAAGITMAASDEGAPLVISFVAGSDGRVLDGSWLGDAVTLIDSLGADPPLFHMCNCMHPVNFARALGRDENAPLVDSGRMIGLQGNASMLGPEELDGREELDSDDPVRWAGAMAALTEAFGIKLLGGCCGTDERHIRRLAQFLSAI